MLSTAQTPDLEWIFPKVDRKKEKEIADEFSIHKVIACVLVNRGLEKNEIQSYLYAKLPNLYSPADMLHIDKATARIYKTQEANGSILIYGDNDVDGMTACALLTEFFRTLKIETHYYIPNRALSKTSAMLDAKEYAKKRGCDLFITVDCGISASDEIKEIQKEGIDVIVTDHHEETQTKPSCIILNPKLQGNTYPNRELTGVGVAFKLAHAYTNYLIASGVIKPTLIDLKNYLDLVCLGTIADLASLTDENRILVRYGLLQLQKTRRVGLIKLMKSCNIKKSQINTIDVNTKLSPKLNSLARIDEARKGVECLLVQDSAAAERLAVELELKNQKRQSIEKLAVDEIEQYFLKHPEELEEKAIVLFSDQWHQGIIALLATRIAKKYNRPCAVISTEDELGKGSLRTITEFPLLPALKTMRHLLHNFGGHLFAAGLTIKKDLIPEFKKSFIELANRKLTDSDIIPKLKIDAKVRFRDMTFEFLESLSLLEPYGMNNQPVVLYCEASQVWNPKVVSGKHLKLFLEEGGLSLEGIAFYQADRKKMLSKHNLKLLIAFTPCLNNYNHKMSIQLLIRDFKVIQEPESDPQTAVENVIQDDSSL